MEKVANAVQWSVTGILLFGGVAFFLEGNASHYRYAEFPSDEFLLHMVGVGLFFLGLWRFSRLVRRSSAVR